MERTARPGPRRRSRCRPRTCCGCADRSARRRAITGQGRCRRQSAAKGTATELGHHPLLLVLGDAREERQRQHRVRRRLGDREVTGGGDRGWRRPAGDGAAPEVDRPRDAGRARVEPSTPIAVGRPDHVAVPDGVVARHGGRQDDRPARRPAGRDSSGPRPGALVPVGEPAELSPQHHRLERVEPESIPSSKSWSARREPVAAQAPDEVGEPAVVGQDGAGVAVGAEVRARVEARARRSLPTLPLGRPCRVAPGRVRPHLDHVDVGGGLAER